MPTEGTPRTWTLETDEYAPARRDWMVTKPAPLIDRPERVEVIEKEPVLDLLEDLIALLDADAFDRSEIEPARSLLRANGRLQPECGECGQTSGHHPACSQAKGASDA
jgi:hypothetical protein